MARKPSTGNNNTETKASSLKDIFDAVDALNADASLLSDENSLSIVGDWIDTGSYALNAIFSGSLYKGIRALEKHLLLTRSSPMRKRKAILRLFGIPKLRSTVNPLKVLVLILRGLNIILLRPWKTAAIRLLRFSIRLLQRMIRTSK
jgi:hypothetical protein